MDKYLYWLDNVSNLGGKAKKCLMDVWGTCEGIYHANENDLKCVIGEKKTEMIRLSKRKWDLEIKYAELIEKEIQMVSLADETYPFNLRNIPDPPFCLYYKGRIPHDCLPGVAVIGARECSEYGRFVAQELGKCLGENQIQVISGMAAGIDGISQSAALAAGGSSYGVLGCGVDVCYPKSNRRLYDELIQNGGILSEYPLGTQPMRQFFPPRNRIVSGLSDVLVVIEARQKSGTSITVEMALEQGKDIYAVPGRVTDRLSDGCNQMLKEGAHVFLSPHDFIKDLYQLLPDKMAYAERLRGEKLYTADEFAQKKVNASESGVKSQEDMIMSVLDFYPQYVDAIAERLVQKYNFSISVSKLNTLLIQLCLLDGVKQEGPGWFSKSIS